MQIHKHPQTNHNYGAPADLNDEQCASLPVIVYTDPMDAWAKSFWKPTAEELAALNEGGCVTLGIRIGSGNPDEPVGHPVVYVGATSAKLEVV